MKSKPTCMCDVGQVVVPGAAGKLLQFSVGQVKSPARGSLLERLLHAPTGRYCGRQLGSIPSSHQRTGLPPLLLSLRRPLHFHTPTILMNFRKSTLLVNFFKSRKLNERKISWQCEL